MTPASDASAADWIVARWSNTFEAQLIPFGFEGCARIFHPAYVEGRRVTWAEIAERFGTAAHARMEWEAITQRAPMDHSPEPGVFDRAPEQGQLPEELVEPTVQILRRYTTTPELCHFAFWYGYGDLPADVRAGAAFSVPGRTYHLCHGSVDDARGFHWTDTEGFSGFYRADSWWPDDRCWFVGSDTDLDSTYVGGSAALVAEVVADPALEAHEVSPDTHFAHRGDDVNV